MTEQLWSDERIDAVLLNRWQGHPDTTSIDSASYRVAIEIACRIRNDYEAQLSAAKEQITELKKMWMPIDEDTDIRCGCGGGLCDRQAWMEDDWTLIVADADFQASIQLPADVRLCRRVTEDEP